MKPEENKEVCWLSGGVSSFIAAYLRRTTLDEVIFIDIEDQHIDTMRFIKDCEKALNKEITILKSKYGNVNNVIQTFNFINNPYGAKCTHVLKRRVRKEWEKSQNANLTYVWGYDCTEINRINRMKDSDQKHDHKFPLLDRNLIKQDAHGILKRLGIKRPEMYEMGYRNNNCVGCVKGGMGYWNKIRRDFPEVLKKRADLERAIGMTCINGIFLDELEPSRGRFEDEIIGECSILCELAYT